MRKKERQRRFLRRSINASFRVRDANGPGYGEILFDSTDLSQGGAFLHSDLLLEVGDELEVTFGLPGEIRPIRVRARVAWATRGNAEQRAGMGLEFLDLTDADRGAIDRFVRASRPVPGT
jgi:uncharacterized protein (TIGR02266 family)